MSGVSLRGKHNPRYNFIWDALERIRFEFLLAAELQEKLDELALIDDEQTRLAACNIVISAIVLEIAGCLRPDLLVEVAIPAKARYNDDLIAPQVRERVRFMLEDLLKFGTGAFHRFGESEEERLALAVSLVETAVAEIGQHVLDKPIVHAQAVAHTLNLVTAYLRGLAARDASEKTWVVASRDVLFLIVLGTSPHYLAAPGKKARRGGDC